MLRRWAPLLAPLTVLLAYARILNAPFVWDDRHLVAESPQVQRLQPILTYFGGAFWQAPGTGDQRGYYRPLTVLSLALDHAVHGDNPAGFHLTNIVLHALNVALLYLLLRRRKISPPLGGLIAAAWGLLPRLTEAAAWVAGRTDVLATTFVLLAMLAYAPNRAGRIALASLLVLSGLFAKEVAVAGVFAIAASELLVLREGRSVRRRVLLALPPAAALAVYLALRQAALRGVHGALEAKLGAGGRVILAFASIGTYARMLALPWLPSLQIGDAAAPGVAVFAAGIVIALALGVVVVRRRDLFLRERRNVQPLVVMGSALAAVGFGVVLHVVPLAVNVIAADRFLYLPTAGLALAIAPCLQAWRAASRVKLAVFGALAAPLFAATYVRVGDWTSEIDLWIKTYRDGIGTPNSVALNEIGGLYYRAGLFEESVTLFALQARTARDPQPAQTNGANARGELGDYDGAEAELARLCGDHPWLANNCFYAGLAELRRLRWDSARAFFGLAMQRAKGDYPVAASSLAVVPQAAALTERPAYEANDPWARFEVDALVGRRLEALTLAEEILAAPALSRGKRREAARYWALLGPPRELSRVLRGESAAGVVDGPLLAFADQRASDAARLTAAWPTLGIGP